MVLQSQVERTVPVSVPNSPAYLTILASAQRGEGNRTKLSLVDLCRVVRLRGPSLHASRSVRLTGPSISWNVPDLTRVRGSSRYSNRKFCTSCRKHKIFLESS